MISDKTWLISYDADAMQLAYEQARGSYQRALLDGDEAWSGSTLQGKAAQYGGRYAESRNNLKERLEKVGVQFRWANKRELKRLGRPLNTKVLVITGLGFE